MLINEKSFEHFGQYVNREFFSFLNNTNRGHHFKESRNHILIDENKNEYEDWVAGFGSLNLGHNPPKIIKAIQESIGSQTPTLYLDAINPYAGQLAQHLCEKTNGHFKNAVFSSSGAEAVETAIKVVTSASKNETILSVEGAFHGTSIGALSYMSEGPYVEDFKHIITKNPKVRWNDIDALEKALKENQPAAFLVEPIQIEAGIRVPSVDYFSKATALCKRYDCLLILDEIQTGLGRCGSLFAYEQMDFTPDILLCGKSFGAGIVPISATLLKEGLWEKAFPGPLKCDVHNSTMAGNKLSCLTANKVLEIISDQAFLKEVSTLGTYLKKQLTEHLSSFECIDNIRGQGLLWGIKLKDVQAPWLQWNQLGVPEFEGKPTAAALLVERLFRSNKITQVCAHDWSVLRIEPPLTINKNIIDGFIEALVSAINWMESNAY